MNYHYDLSSQEQINRIILQIANSIIASILAGPHHNFLFGFTLLTGRDLSEFTNKCELSEFITSKHFKDRIKFQIDRLKNASAILFIEMQRHSKPLDIDCGICGWPDCKSHNSECNGLCAIDMLSFGRAVSRGQQTAKLLDTSNFIAQSFAIAARELGIVHADFAMAMILTLSEGYSSSLDNKLEINREKIR